MDAKYKIIKEIESINFPKKYNSKAEKKYYEMIKKAKPIKNIELFNQSNDEVEILKGCTFQEYRTHPRVAYEMANTRMGEVAFLDTDRLSHEELYSFMNVAERRAYDSLPTVFIGYRGYSSAQVDTNKAYTAQSWTVKKEVAEFFANEHYRDGFEIVLIEKIIFKSDIALVLLQRNEAEIVLKVQ